MSQSRQLAAIMFTDIVGYTALMDEDEQRAFELLKKNRQVQRPLIEKYNGKWLKEMGDGVLASFSTVTDAVFCAAAIQKSCEDEPDLKLRIGIHQGEVVFDGEDVFGSGVNIASRLEPLAPIGGILVSESVHRNLGNKKNIVSTFLREEQLKNVKEPIRIYSVKVKGVEPVIADELSDAPQDVSSKSWNPGKTAFAVAGVLVILLLSYFLYSNFGAQQQLADARTEATDKSIAVRPFWNESSEKENEYFVNGMTEDIRNNLAKISEMRVISRGSMEKYRQTELTTREIANELEVSYLLEGTVQKLGSQVKIHAQLILANVDNHIWEDTYVRDLDDVEKIFKVQSEIAQIIAMELNATISADEKKRLELIPTTDITAYDFVLKADQSMHNFYMTQDLKQLATSYDLYHKAFQKDPDFPRALLGLAAVFLQRSNYDSTLLFIDNTLRLDPENANALALKGAYFNAIGQQEDAFNYFLKAQQLTPSNWWVNFVLGDMYLRVKNDIVNGLSFMQRAYNVNTESRDGMYSNIGRCYFHIGDFEKAEYYFSKALELNVGCVSIMNFGWMYNNMGKFNAAIEFYDAQCKVMDCDLLCSLQRFYTNLYLKNYEASQHNYQNAVDAGRDPDYHLDLVALACVYKGLEQFEKEDSVLNKVLSEIQNQPDELYNQFSYLMLACVYALQQDKTKAIENLLDYEEFGFSVWSNEIKIFPAFEQLWDEPEFVAIVNRMEQEKAKLRSKIRILEDKGDIDF